MTHDRNFKNLILDYPGGAIALFKRVARLNHCHLMVFVGRK